MMNQNRRREKRDEITQPSIKSYITNIESLKTKEESGPNNTPRSRPTKRKVPPSPASNEKQKESDCKTLYNRSLSPINMEGITEPGTPLTLEAVQWLLQPLDERINEVLNQQKEMINIIGEGSTLKEENEKLKQRVAKVEDINGKLVKRLTHLENKMMESCVILTGVKEDVWETDEVRREKIFAILSNTVLGTTYEDRLDTVKIMYIKHSSRLGKFRRMYNRPVSVEFLYKEDADYLLNNRSYLPDGVFVDRQYSKETEEERKQLHPYLKAARQLPHYHRCCKLGENVLVIKGISYTIDDIHRLPPDLSGDRICSKSDPETYGFFGRLHLFSNFYQVPFKFQGNSYHSSEQMIQHLKATFFDADDIADQIMSTTTALECKNLARDIPNYNHKNWNSIAKEMCEGGIKAKFMQNIPLQTVLTKTGTRVLAECCLDQTWGTGVPLHDEQVLNQHSWIGQGILGKILEEIRADIINNQGSACSQNTSSHAEADPPTRTATETDMIS